MGTGIKEVVVSWIRTALVPPVAGILVQWLLVNNIDLFSEGVVINAVTFLLIGIWYLVFRGLEVLSTNPRVKRIAGIFLGYPRFPKV